MKNFTKLGLLFVGLVIGNTVFGQEDSTKVKKDTSSFNIGDLEVILVEKEGELEKKFEEGCEDDCYSDEDRAHWAGFDIGINGFTTWDNQISLPAESRFMELDYSKSINLSLNFYEKHIKLIKEHVGITTGLGVQFNRYAFKNDMRLTYDSDGIYETNDSVVYTKNVLKSSYLQLPVLLEFNTSKNPEKSFHLAAGVVGGVKLGSKIKQEYEFQDDDRTDKIPGHYHLNPFQLNYTVRLGYGDFTVFATYSQTRLFEKDKGPQLYPFTVGLTLIGF